MNPDSSPFEPQGLAGVGGFSLWTDADDPAADVVIPAAEVCTSAAGTTPALLPGGPLPDADLPDPHFEDRAHPHAALWYRTWARDHRDVIRRCLASPLGLTRRPRPTAAKEARP